MPANKLKFYPDASGVIALVGHSGEYPALEADVKREASRVQPDPCALGKRLAEGLGVKWVEGRFEKAAVCLLRRHAKRKVS